MGMIFFRFIVIIFISIILSCSGDSSTQSVEDVGEETPGENTGGGSGGIVAEPVASFTISSSGGEAPHDVTFTSTSTGEINSWLWNVDDDSDFESNYFSFTHTYETVGSFNISLTVTGPGGQNIFTEYNAVTITESSTSTQTGLLSKDMQYDNETREYLIYIPENYDSNSSVPILFAFHGFGGYSQYFINTADFRDLADQFNFIAVYPQGLVCQDGTTWNTNPPGGDNKCSQDDIGFFAALLNQISVDYNIDSYKVYLTGFSNGADFTYSMACYQSDLVTAIAPVSGLMPMDNSNECNPNHATSLMIFNGTNDDSRPYSGITGYMMSVDQTVSYWSSYNNTDSSPQTNIVGNIENYSYLNGNNSTTVELFKIINGYHSWFNLSFNGNSTEELIWNFFSQN